MENKKGKQGLDRKDLELAYAENAFGCHYLTDAFAAGHMRTPRKALQDHFKKIGVVLMGYMHDQDNATGLHVHNAKGVSWTAYGDQHYFDTADKTNRQMIHYALQTSVDSIYKAYSTGKDVNKNETAVHQWLPNYHDLANYKKYHNTKPMFVVNAQGQIEYSEEGETDQGLENYYAGVHTLFALFHQFGRPM